jgi:uncharacterized 2Fe-2S/4Fe-4S cluster protein (DUF4445 family)
MGAATQVAQGTLLIDALKRVGVDIDASCGGQATCGKCAVRVVSGTVEGGEAQVLSKEQLAQGYVLACQARMSGTALVLEVPEQQGRTGGKFAEDDGALSLIPQDRLPAPEELSPLVRPVQVSVDAPALEDGLGDAERVARALGNAGCRGEAQFALDALRETGAAVRAESGRATAWVGDDCGTSRVITLRAGAGHALLGAAIDIGTTTVAVMLVSLVDGRPVATVSDYNEQVGCGLDVISRINYARREGGLEELRRRVLQTVNRLTASAAEQARVARDDIVAVSMAGNTTMVHLLLGLPPERIRLEPYTPTVLRPSLLRAGDIGLDVRGGSPVFIAPAVGSYVGGDIVSGLLCTPLADPDCPDGLRLFMDIGTNGELVLGGRDFLMACACSAGPAFEGGGISCGMRACAGAIDHVSVDPATGAPTCRVIGGGAAQGICGSGMIALVTELFRTGWMDPAGKLKRDGACAYVRPDGRRAQYVLQVAEASAGARELTVREVDIDNLLRAKAAVYAACSLVMERAGATFGDVAQVFIAGGFGRALDVERAVTLGLLPDIPRDRFVYLGNSSLAGAYMTLVSARRRSRAADTAHRMTYLELNTEPAYMDQYTAALFVPHTDRGRFPSVA